ncbi:MAG TPA: hypothetical protein EYN91_01110 [Candidatus Melainabacteria bacterium]|nr:hypothetical protein [Candidatus Melainabacteria bacterium]HIN64276.1 hypothetical protein [Candidatus Obscuribacterales bacterium]
MHKLREKYKGINDGELEVFLPLQYLDPTFFRLRDYASVFARGAAFGIALNFPLIILGLVTPSLMPVYLPCMTTAACILGISFSAAAKGFQMAFSKAVSAYGIEAFLTYEDVRLPLAKAYELCLAATTEIPKASILECIEGRRICVRVKGYPDRTIVIRLDPLGRGITRIAIDSVKHLSLPQSIAIRTCWGTKFEQLILRVDDGSNAQLIEQIASFVRETPDWDYVYEGFKPLRANRR